MKQIDPLMRIDTVAGFLDSTWSWQVITFILPAPTVFLGEPTMFGPGEYVPDPTEGIVNVKDLPAPQLGFYSRSHKQTPCPRCGDLASRHKSDQRTLGVAACKQYDAGLQISVFWGSR